MARPSDTGGWLAPALALVAAVTGLRLVLLAFDRTDLFVDEAQYWLWGQHFAFGYFSKPPLIAWVIGAVTALAGSDAVFWIRMPAALLHGATALILAALAARVAGRQVAVWVAAAYVTLPMAAVGSLLISTDTVMAPFFAAGLLFHHRLLTQHRLTDAALVGLMAGLACLAKYAGVYLPAGIALAAVLRPDLRPRLVEVLVMAGVWAAVFAPNLIWNLTNGAPTLAATGENIGWIERGNPLTDIGLDDLVEFWGSQLAVMGPVMLGALLIGLARFRRQPLLAAFVVIPLAVVSVQSILDQALANWAVSAYFSGTVLAMTVLRDYPRWRLASMATNAAICLILPLLTLFPDLGPGGKPLLDRYIGRSQISREIVDLAKRAGAVPVVADNRDIIADLFYTGRDAGLMYFTPPPQGRPKSHYQLAYPMPPDMMGRVLLVTETPPVCPSTPQKLDLAGTAYFRLPLAAYIVDATCARWHGERQRP